MVVKAKLKVVLYADDHVVAESEDAAFWGRVLSAVSSANPSASLEENDVQEPKWTAGRKPGSTTASADDVGGPPEVRRLAKELGVSLPVLQGACSPETEQPYIHLDTHCFEAFKKNTGARGPAAIPNVTLAATLLVLWKKHGKLGDLGVAEVQAVLDTLHLRGPNAARSLKNCRWLQYRSGRVTLHPAEASRALAVAKAFCEKTPVETE